MSQNLDEAVDSFVTYCNEMQKDHWAKSGFKHERPSTFQVNRGNKWIKLILVRNYNDGTSQPTSVFAFIAAASFQNKNFGMVNEGDIHKPADYRSPAKHARGSVFQEGYNNCVSPYGIAYLK